MGREPIVAIGLLTDSDLMALGPEFRRAYPVDNSPCFQELIEAIDERDRRRSPDVGQPQPRPFFLSGGRSTS